MADLCTISSGLSMLCQDSKAGQVVQSQTAEIPKCPLVQRVVGVTTLDWNGRLQVYVEMVT